MSKNMRIYVEFISNHVVKTYQVQPKILNTRKLIALRLEKLLTN